VNSDFPVNLSGAALAARRVEAYPERGMQSALSDPFRADPFFFGAATALAVVAGVVALVAWIILFKKPKIGIVIGALAVLGSLAAFGFGALGWSLAENRVDGAASHPGLSSADRDRITTKGYAEARVCLTHGTLAAALPFVAGAAALALSIARRAGKPA
jgi:hypothetical protein